MKTVDAHMKRAIANLRYEISSVVARRPGLYMPLERIRGRHTENLVSDRTQITIEGFPRSGTSFACRAFQHANPDVLMAHHKHAAAQILASVHRGLPTLLIIRRPEASVRSLLVRRPELNAKSIVRAWVRFHQPLEGCKDGFVIGTFDQVTRDFGDVMRQVNKKFNSSFACFVHTPQNVEAVFREMDRDNAAAYGYLRQTHVPRPEASREELKKSICLDHIQADLRLAEKIYNALISRL